MKKYWGIWSASLRLGICCSLHLQRESFAAQLSYSNPKGSLSHEESAAGCIVLSVLYSTVWIQIGLFVQATAAFFKRLQTTLTFIHCGNMWAKECGWSVLVPEKVPDEASRLGSRRAIRSLWIKHTDLYLPCATCGCEQCDGQETGTEMPQEQNAQGQHEQPMGRAMLSSKQAVKHKSDKTSGSRFK